MNFSVELEPSARSVRLARSAVTDWLDEIGAHALVEPAVLLVSELATNAVIHVGQPYWITGSWEPPRFRVEVCDPGPALPARLRPTTDQVQPGGRGLVIVDQIASAWGVATSNDHKVVWFDLEDTAGPKLTPGLAT